MKCSTKKVCIYTYSEGPLIDIQIRKNTAVWIAKQQKLLGYDERIRHLYDLWDRL